MPANVTPPEHDSAQTYANRMNACKIQAEAYQRLYDAALVVRDYATCDKHRAKLHELLDLELDCKSSMYSIIQKGHSNRHK